MTATIGFLTTTGFFDDFPKFTRDPEASISAEFNRLAHQRQWKKGSKTWHKMWNRCMNMEYDRLIGESLTGLQGWQQICEELDVTGSFTSITQCKRALSKVYVNIVDLLDCRALKQKPKMFPNLQALRKYTTRTQKFFSRDLAKQDQLLRVLLRRIL